MVEIIMRLTVIFPVDLISNAATTTRDYPRLRCVHCRYAYIILSYCIITHLILNTVGLYTYIGTAVTAPLPQLQVSISIPINPGSLQPPRLSRRVLIDRSTAVTMVSYSLTMIYRAGHFWSRAEFKFWIRRDRRYGWL